MHISPTLTSHVRYVWSCCPSTKICSTRFQNARIKYRKYVKHKTLIASVLFLVLSFQMVMMFERVCLFIHSFIPDISMRSNYDTQISAQFFVTCPHIWVEGDFLSQRESVIIESWVSYEKDNLLSGRVSWHFCHQHKIENKLKISSFRLYFFLIYSKSKVVNQSLF